MAGPPSPPLFLLSRWLRGVQGNQSESGGLLFGYFFLYSAAETPACEERQRRQQQPREKLPSWLRAPAATLPGSHPHPPPCPGGFCCNTSPKCFSDLEAAARPGRRAKGGERRAREHRGGCSVAAAGGLCAPCVGAAAPVNSEGGSSAEARSREGTPLR